MNELMIDYSQHASPIRFLYNNQLNGTIPSSIESLVRLRTLYVDQSTTSSYQIITLAHWQWMSRWLVYQYTNAHHIIPVFE